MQTVQELGPRLGVASTCAALGLSPATYYRGQKPKLEPKPRFVPRALTAEEYKRVLEILHEPRFVDPASGHIDRGV